MEFLQAIFLALIQGITEFLPISSSGHLILPHAILGWQDQGLAFDTSVHLGSLIAVVAYFRRDLARLAGALVKRVRQGETSEDSRFTVNLMIASLPIIPVGYYARFLVESELRAIEVIAATTIIFGIALWAADHFRSNQQRELTPFRALMIGLAQCLALIPGTSRSGITITMALLLGFTRTEAARISLLLAIPTIAGAALLKLWDLAHQPVPDWGPLLVGTVVAGLSAYACIAWLLRFVEQIGYLPFVIYRLLLGSLLIMMIL